MILNNNLTTGGLKKAILYTRVSSEEQVENFSLGTQEEICRRDATNKGYEIVEVFKEEGKSAKTISGRPVLVELLEYCRKNKNNIQALFVYRLDRLSRQTSDYLAIRKKLAEYNIAILSANEPTGNSPTEKLLETILASFAQHDNDVRSERTKNGMRARFLSGLSISHAPLGYVHQGGYILKDPETFDIVKRAWDLMATGTKSLNEMSTIMAEWGIKIQINTLSRIFNNKFYMGILTSPAYPEEVRGQHTPMITEEQFYRVREIIKGRDPNKLLMPHKTRDNTDFPLRVIMRCGKCGTPFTGAWSKGTHARYGYYFCRKRCVTTSIPAGTLDIEFKKLLKKFTPTERGIRLYCAYILRTYNKKMAKLHKTKNAADEEIQKLYAVRKMLIEKNLNGTYSDEIFKEQNAAVEARIIAAQASKNDALIDKYNVDEITKFIKAKISDLEATYSTSKLSPMRCLLRSIFLSGFKWEYPGCSNDGISPLYQPILDVDKTAIPLGDPCESRTRLTWMRTMFPTDRRTGQTYLLGTKLYFIYQFQARKKQNLVQLTMQFVYNGAMSKMMLSVVIPSYNEMGNLRKGTLTKVQKYLDKQNYDYEVIVVDDGSTDGSREFAKDFSDEEKEFRLIENSHSGKAGAVTTGMLEAKGDYILFTDMDQATPIV